MATPSDVEGAITKTIILKNETREMTFEEVLKRTEIKSLVLTYKKRWDFYETDDIKQMILVAIWETYKLYDYKKGYKFKTLAEKLVNDKLIHFHKGQNRHKRFLEPKNKISLDYQNEQHDLEIDSEIVIYNKFEERLVNRIMVKDGISKMQGKDKRYLKYIHYYMMGYESTEVARLENKDESTVYMKTKRAFKLLRKIIETGVGSFKITKKELEELYINKKYSAAKIGKIINMNRDTVRYYLIQYDIPRRGCYE